MTLKSSDLLREAAKALDDQRDPLLASFLSEHDVTLDECMNLAENLAIGARMAAYALDNPRTPLGRAYIAEIVAHVMNAGQQS
jgi:hypothetical protein